MGSSCRLVASCYWMPITGHIESRVLKLLWQCAQAVAMYMYSSCGNDLNATMRLLLQLQISKTHPTHTRHLFSGRDSCVELAYLRLDLFLFSSLRLISWAVVEVITAVTISAEIDVFKTSSDIWLQILCTDSK